MHERTRLVLARLLFVLCCALPTSLTVTWIAATHTPWYEKRITDYLQDQIQRDTGLHLAFTEFDNPAPNRWVLSNVHLTDPETSQLMGKIREIHWAIQSNETTVLLEQPEINASHIAIVLESLHDHILCRPRKTEQPITLFANDLTIHSGSHAVTLSDVDARIANKQRSTLLSIELQVADADPNSPMMLQVQRIRQEKNERRTMPSKTVMSLNTKGTALPCSAFADFWPALGSLGRRANFSGSLKWEVQEGTWAVDLGGSRFNQIELDQLFENQAHRLSGTASITFDRGLVSPDQRIADLSGVFLAEQGLISKTLLSQASQNLNLRLLKTEPWTRFTGDLPYDLFAIGFDINGTQLKLDGICHHEQSHKNYPSGIALLLNGYPLAHCTGDPVESVRLLATLAPAHSVPVPLSQQTNWLTSILVPPSRPMPVEQNEPPRIRSARLWQGGPVIEQPNRGQ